MAQAWPDTPQGNNNTWLGMQKLERIKSNSAGGTRELLSRGAHCSSPREFQLTDRAKLGRSAQIRDYTEELKGHEQQGKSWAEVSSCTQKVLKEERGDIQDDQEGPAVTEIWEISRRKEGQVGQHFLERQWESMPDIPE